MSDEKPTEKKRSWRMVLWLVALPAVILLLALAGANWKFFHLAYGKHLIGSPDPVEQNKGVWMVMETHLRKGMSPEEVRRLLAPAKLTERPIDSDLLELRTVEKFRIFDVSTGKRRPYQWAALLFDKNDKLLASDFYSPP